MDDHRAHSAPRPDTTDYYADFELTTLVRQVAYSDGTIGQEPLWLECGAIQGLALFVSALDAELYRQLAHASGSIGWRRVPLARFDLLQHVLRLGGQLYCKIVYGFSAAPGARLATREGLPRTILVQAGLEVPLDAVEPVNFDFAAQVFDFIRQQWAPLADDYPAQVKVLSAASETELAAVAAHALDTIACLEIDDGNDDGDDGRGWCIYSPGAKAWCFGSAELRVPAQLH